MAKRITKIAAGLMAVMLALSFISQASAANLKYFYDFQKSLDPWTAGLDCNPGLLQDSPVNRCDAGKVLQMAELKKGENAAALYNQGANAVWMRSDYFIAGSGTVVVEFDAYNVKQGDRLTPIIYTNWLEPQSLYDFQKIGVPLEKGSQHITFKAHVPAFKAPLIQFVVAIGFMNLDGNQYTQVGGIDNVRITFYDL